MFRKRNQNKWIYEQKEYKDFYGRLYIEEKQKYNVIKDEWSLIPYDIMPYHENCEYYNENDLLFVDVETTGLNDDDEILQLSIIDYKEEVLFNKYIKPKEHKEWKKAQGIHKISPNMVKEEKQLDEYKEDIINILSDKIIVGYNIDFDFNFLVKEGLVEKNYRTIDVMKPIALLIGEWVEWKEDFKWQPLNKATEYYSYKWDGECHDSLSDIKATLFVFKKHKNFSLVHWYDSREINKNKMIND